LKTFKVLGETVYNTSPLIAKRAIDPPFPAGRILGLLSFEHDAAKRTKNTKYNKFFIFQIFL